MKKYYWLKLKDDFFTQKAIKKLRKIAGGDTFTIIYLKMMLVAIKSEGKIFHEGIETNFHEELALDLDEDEENVKLTISYLLNHGLMEESQNEYFLPESITNTGSESDSAERVRRYRQKKLQFNSDVTSSNALVTVSNAKVTTCNTEKEIEIEKEIEKDTDKREKKVKYSESVYLSKDEYMKLMDKYETEQRLNQGIEILNNYLMTNGKKYKSHYHVLIGWVHERVIQDVSKHERDRHEVNTRKNTGNEGSQFTFRQKDYL